MKLSDKKKKQINSEATQALIEALKNNPMCYQKNQEDWWLSPPDTWTDAEKEMFDLLSYVTSDVAQRAINVIENK